MKMYSLRQQLQLWRVNEFVIAWMRLIFEFLVMDLYFLFKFLRVPMFCETFRHQNCTRLY